MRVGGFSIYGILIALGVFAAVRLCGKDEARLGLPKDTAYDLALWCLPAGILGARLYYVAFQWDYYRENLLSILKIWEGGLAIYGGIIGGILAALLLSRVRKLPFFALADMAMPTVLLAQAIGRWGNFFNGEAHGNPVENPALQFFPFAVNISGIWYQATFFYEFLWDLMGFILLWTTRKKWARGDGLALYFIVYGLGRMWIEGLRTDSLMAGSVRVSQLLSGVLVILSAIYLIVRHTLCRKRGNNEQSPV